MYLYVYMTRHFFVTIAIFFSLIFSCRAQVSLDSITDALNLPEPHYKPYSQDHLIFELNYTGWTNLPAGIKPSWKSIGFNFAFMFDKPLGRSRFSIGYGIGFYGHNLNSNGEVAYRPSLPDSGLFTDFRQRSTSYKVNRFADRILELPVELRFRTWSLYKFKVMVGGKIGYILNDFLKIDDDNGKVKIYNTKNLNRFSYAVNCRIGVRRFFLTGTYYFSNVFMDGKGQANLNRYSIGIAFIPI